MYSDAHLSMPIGSYAMLSVTDTGTGMDAETMSHAFEPFFTTKQPGKGTGLGLSTVYGIVKQSGGWIWVYSEPGRGTTFKIYLPRVQEEAAVEVPEKRVEAPVTHGGERILVVEDDAMVRRLITQALRKQGYDVIESSSGAAALQMVEGDDGPLALLVTDVVMPGMSGLELAENLRRSRPAIQVLFMSGYTDDAVVRHGLLDAAMAFLQKPFTPSGLARKVREVLDEGAGGASQKGGALE
jgi:CheY-like chemotaxis protein